MALASPLGYETFGKRFDEMAKRLDQFAREERRRTGERLPQERRTTGLGTAAAGAGECQGAPALRTGAEEDPP